MSEIGVTTYEVDKTFVASTVPQIGGACFIGQTLKGKAFSPTVIQSYSEYVTLFGGTHPDYYMPYGVRSYLNYGGPATIIRTLGSGGYNSTGSIPLIVTSASVTNIIGWLHPSYAFRNNADIEDIYSVFIDGSGSGKSAEDFSMTIICSDGASSYTTSSYTHLSLNSAHSSFVGNVFGFEPLEKTEYFYLRQLYDDVISIDSNWTIYSGFDVIASASLDNQYYVYQTGSSLMSSSADYLDYTYSYTHPSTPWIISQDFGSGSTHKYYQLFKIHARSDGEEANDDIKIEISNINPATRAFDLLVREFSDTDSKKNIYERFTNLSLDPTDKNYIARKIGDRYSTISSEGKVKYYGNYSNKSNYIYLEINAELEEGRYPTAQIQTHGFEGYNYTTIGLQNDISSSYTDINEVAISYRTLDQVYDASTGGLVGQKSSKVCYGVKFFDDTKYFLIKKPKLTDSSATLTDSSFHLESCAYTSSTGDSGSVSTSASCPIRYKKFCLPLQGGWNGYDITKVSNYFTGSNARFDVSSATTTGTTDYRNALNILKNPELVINYLLFLPEIQNSTVTQYALDIIEDEARQDMFYPTEMQGLDDTISNIETLADTWDTSYSCVYYPWLKVYDYDYEKYVWVPPTSVVPEAYSFTDKNAFPWFAVSGKNRGVLGGAIEVRDRMTPDERKEIYDYNVNPIVEFSGDGIVIWGNQTLQSKTSKLSLINVRRLMIYARSLIKRTVDYLVEEPIDTIFVDRFLKIVDPIMENIKDNRGIYEYKIVVDESINTEDSLDRNEFNAMIYLKPTAVAETINIGFVISAAGVSFTSPD